MNGSESEVNGDEGMVVRSRLLHVSGSFCIGVSWLTLIQQRARGEGQTPST
jgi:hypothetical protein